MRKRGGKEESGKGELPLYECPMVVICTRTHVCKAQSSKKLSFMELHSLDQKKKKKKKKKIEITVFFLIFLTKLFKQKKKKKKKNKKNSHHSVLVTLFYANSSKRTSPKLEVETK
jgi:hypothetical protein